MADEPKGFYIGRTVDPETGKTGSQAVVYDPDDLTTHAVVVGMTGSGKTGLCVDFIEEAALQGLPALLIDPKGDLTNLVLRFPELRPEDFEPWVDADQARREGQTVAEAAQATAETWRRGLAEWGIEPSRIARLMTSVETHIYSPGSDAATPISILASLQAPQLAWDEHRETIRERISSTATALLGLVGIEADPVRSREHILLANILEHAWSRGQDLDLVELIRQIQSPPFNELGAFDVEQFFPGKERGALSMVLNNLLASPSFQAWTEGQPLNIGELLWRPDGLPRHSIIYLAHLSEAERMFFVTLLLSAIEAWMRTQPGSAGLRALLYFDEILGFLPPVANPPSKPPLLRLVKQARAYGLGLMMVTQNPVDLDYKGLGNAGTWLIGRLQAERDKARLLEGLEGSQIARRGFDRASLDRTISSLGKRVFLLHNVHARSPVLFQTRWAMAYLRGPLTRAQLRRANALAAGEAPSGGAALPAAAKMSPQLKGAPLASAAGSPSPTRVAPPSGIREYFLPNDRTASDALKAAGRPTTSLGEPVLVYKPVVAAQATIRYLQRKIDLDDQITITAIIHNPDPRGILRWEEGLAQSIEPASLDRSPLTPALFYPLTEFFTDERRMKSLEKDFLDYVFRSAELRLPGNEALKLIASPGETREDFRLRCGEAAGEFRDQEAAQLGAKYENKLKALQARLSREGAGAGRRSDRTLRPENGRNGDPRRKCPGFVQRLAQPQTGILLPDQAADDRQSQIEGGGIGAGDR
jgi:hypothetical protein